MKYYCLFVLIFPFCVVDALWGQNSTLTFKTSEKIGVRMYKPIDGSYNSYVVSERFELKPGISITYDLTISDFAIVKCQFDNGKTIDAILQNGDNVQIEYTTNEVVFKGNNSAGNQFFNKRIVRSYLNKIDSVFLANMDDGINCSNINNSINLFMNFPLLEIHEMVNKGKITPGFAEILKDDLLYTFNYEFIYNYLVLLKGEKVSLTSKDSILINKSLDSLFQIFPFTEKNIVKHRGCSLYASRYYQRMYNRLSLLEKQNLVDKYKAAFGKYIHYYLSPDFIQLPFMGEAVITQIEYKADELDVIKMLNYLNERYPYSEYLQILNQLIPKEGKTNKDSIIILTENIKSFKELSIVEGIKSNYIFIDLWATWCIPCKIEFKYNKDLHAVLNKYKNLVSVYISIDDDELDESWKKQVEQFRLEGYNLRASKSLIKEIKAKVFNGETLTIPRYILLDSDGNIVENNLPRPSALKKVKEILDAKLIRLQEPV